MRQQVAAERERRGLSVREAATAGGITNTTWARYEQGGPLTPKIRKAVAQAFGWETDWPDLVSAPAGPSSPSGVQEFRRQAMREMQRLALEVAALRAEVEELKRHQHGRESV